VDAAIKSQHDVKAGNNVALWLAPKLNPVDAAIKSQHDVEASNNVTLRLDRRVSRAFFSTRRALSRNIALDETRDSWYKQPCS